MRKLWLTGALVLLGTVAVATLALAQTTSNGPYYARGSLSFSNMTNEAVLDRETGLV